MHINRLWEEAGAPGENPPRHRDSVQTPHKKVDVNLGLSCCEQTALAPFWERSICTCTGSNSPPPLHKSREQSCKSSRWRVQERWAHFSLPRHSYFSLLLHFNFRLRGTLPPICCFLIKDCNFVLVWVILYNAERIKRGRRKQERNTPPSTPQVDNSAASMCKWVFGDIKMTI